MSAPGANALGERLAGVPASRVSFKRFCASAESGLIPGRARVARQTAEWIFGRALDAERDKRQTMASGEGSTSSFWFRVGPGGDGDRCADCTGCGAFFLERDELQTVISFGLEGKETVQTAPWAS